MAELTFINLEGLQAYDGARVAKIKADADERLSALKAEVDGLKAAKVHVGDAEPGQKEKDAVWIDTAEKVVKVYDGSAWVRLGAVYQ